MVKKLRKITIFKRLCHFWFGKFVVRYYRIIYRIVWKVTRVIYVKTSEAVFLVLSTYFGGQQQIKPTIEANIILQVAIFSRRVVVNYMTKYEKRTQVISYLLGLNTTCSRPQLTCSRPQFFDWKQQFEELCWPLLLALFVVDHQNKWTRPKIRPLVSIKFQTRVMVNIIVDSSVPNKNSK